MNTSLNKGIKNNGIISDENIKIKGEKVKISKISKNKERKEKKIKIWSLLKQACLMEAQSH